MASHAELIAPLREAEELLGHCVHCGFCLPACPTYQELGDEADSPRGRLHLMLAVVEGRLEPEAEAFQLHMDRCLGCRACESVCPSGVEYGHLLERARAVSSQAHPPSLLARTLLRTMGSPSRNALFGAAGRLLRATGLPALVAQALPSLSLLAPARLGMGMLAASAPARLSGSGTPTSPAPREPLPTPEPKGRVILFRGCIQDQLFRQVHEATKRALKVNGWELLEVEDPGCCGALHAHAGALEEAKSLALSRVEALLRVGGDKDPIVVNAAGCGAFLKDLPGLVADGEDRGVAARIRDISELLAGEGRVPLPGAPLPLRVVYDPPCHLLHGQRISGPPVTLLRSIPELQLLPLRDADRCCGGAGIYGITHPELGGQIGGGKVEAILESGCEVVATGNPGCQMQIGAGLRMAGHPVPVVHPVELLAESYRRAGW